MNLDWGRHLDLRDQNVTLHVSNRDVAPRVTIGMPTYRRPETIRRALRSIAAQSYRQFVLIISDNNGPDPQTIAAVREIETELPEMAVIAQSENIGALSNLNMLLALAETEYFMWLADDDEVTPDYLEELVQLLDADQTAVTAMGRWKMMTSPEEGTLRTQLRLDAAGRAARLFRFVAGEADDSAFYGVHRTSALRCCSFRGFLPPNRGVLTNWCYVLLFDLLLRGRIVFAKQATWICHNYSIKQYVHARARGLRDRIGTLLRRVNVYGIYVTKTARHAPMLLPVVVVASVVGLVRDVVSAAWRIALRIMRGSGSG